MNHTSCSKVTIRVLLIDEQRQKCGRNICTGISKIEFFTGMVEAKQADCPPDDVKDEDMDSSMLFFEEPTNVGNYANNKRIFQEE